MVFYLSKRKVTSECAETEHHCNLFVDIIFKVEVKS